MRLEIEITEIIGSNPRKHSFLTACPPLKLLLVLSLCRRESCNASGSK
jgi:hypothetical protein